MKRVLYSLVGFAWGIFLFNKEILIYALFLSIVAIATDLVTDDK